MPKKNTKSKYIINHSKIKIKIHEENITYKKTQNFNQQKQTFIFLITLRSLFVQQFYQVHKLIKILINT